MVVQRGTISSRRVDALAGIVVGLVGCLRAAEQVVLPEAEQQPTEVGVQVRPLAWQRHALRAGARHEPQRERVDGRRTLRAHVCPPVVPPVLRGDPAQGGEHVRQGWRARREDGNRHVVPRWPEFCLVILVPHREEAVAGMGLRVVAPISLIVWKDQQRAADCHDSRRRRQPHRRFGILVRVERRHQLLVRLAIARHVVVTALIHSDGARWSTRGRRSGGVQAAVR
mmetsp:Transcript_100807/g.310828  ORF Transcript_100807/g.310828 Transcript_100807/m.310828 type:complete len:226 (-) Transcript_100807:169-846(-)